jgi:hypothetical protein
VLGSGALSARPSRDLAASLARLSRVALGVATISLLVTLVLYAVDAGARLLAASLSLAICAAGVHWFSRGRLLAVTGALDGRAPAGRRAAPAMRGVGVLFMVLGAVAILSGASLLYFGAIG